MLAGTRKPLMVATRNGGVVKAVKDMCAAAGAPDSFMIYAMPAPPLMHDRDGLTKLAACAEHEVPIIWAAAPNAGSTGPRSIAGTAVVGNAETLAGLVYHQQIRPGAPFVFGVGVGAMDMRTAVDAYTTPESPLGQAAQEDLCRWYGLPSFNYAAMSDSKTIDEQFALEYGLTAMAGALPRGTLVHDVGYLESGLQSSCESIVFGNAAVGWAKAFMSDVPTDDEALALDEITDGRPGRQLPGPQVHPPPRPRLLVRRALRPRRLRPLERRRRARRCSTASRRASPSCAPTRAFTLDPAARARSPPSCRPPGRSARRDRARRRRAARRARARPPRRAARLGRRGLPAGCTRRPARCSPRPASRCATRGRSSCCGRRARVSATPAPACRASSSTGALASAPRASRSGVGRADGSLDRELADGETWFGTGPDCLYVADPRDGRRRARLADVERYAGLCERLPNIDFVMSMGLPEDADPERVDLAQLAAMLAGTRKPIVVSSPFGGASLRAMVAMAAACGQAGSLACLTMSSPPLQLDEACLDKLLVCGRARRAGRAGAVALGRLDRAGLDPGDRRRGQRRGARRPRRAPARPPRRAVPLRRRRRRAQHAHHGRSYRAPGVALGNQACIDLARWYGLPSWAYAGDSDSKLFDEQAAAEAAMGAILGELCRATLLHDVGYLESGLQSSYESLVLGDELAGYARAFGGELPVDDEALALDEIMRAGPGGNHLARPLTRAPLPRLPSVRPARPVGLRALAGRGRDHPQAACRGAHGGLARQPAALHTRRNDAAAPRRPRRAGAARPVTLRF